MQGGIYKYEPLWGEWKIDSVIGKGSYGEVYKIYKVVNGKRYEAAAKYISIPKSEQEKDLAYSKGMATDEDSLRSFFTMRANDFSKEIDLMMKLRGSENIVSYEAHMMLEKKDDIGWDIVIRMELLTALEKYLRTTSFTQRDVINLGIDICSAIESCQSEQIIHRDVKIENIFIDGNGRFKLGDFGVSREAQGTTMGTITGTEDYMAPEIMKHEKYNSNVDIYSIGIVMYRLLNNNRIPFLPPDGPINDNDISQALSKRLDGNEKIPDPKYASGRLAEIIAKACAFDRHERYQSPSEMAAELAKALREAENIEVLKPRKKAADTASKTGGATISEIDIGGSGADITTIQPEEKKKSFKHIIAGAIAGIVCIIAVAMMLIPGSVPLEKISGIPEDTVQMLANGKYEFVTELYPENTTSEISYVSLNENIATVDENGVVSANGIGEVDIEVRVDGNVYETVHFNIVEEKIPVTDIRGIEPSAALDVGGSITLYAQVLPQDATEQTVVYASSNPAVATVSPEGVITGVSAGQSQITATVDGITKTMTLTVKAKPQTQNKTTPGAKKPSASQEKETKSESKTESQPSNDYTPPAAPQPPAVNNTPAASAGNSNSGGGSAAQPSKPSQQYEAGDLSAFQ